METMNILIAVLGDHPAVITAAVNALDALAGIPVHRLHVIHPQDSGKYIGREGYRLVKNHLRDRCDVLSTPLPFADANSTVTSIQFLRILTNLLEQYRDEQAYRVYLLVSGGRKNMAALMAVATQFFGSVCGLYHLLDLKEESRNPLFPSIEQMELEMTEAEVVATLSPPLERLNLISIPFPGAVATSKELWQALKSFESESEIEALHLSMEAERFFRQVFLPSNSGATLDVWLSEQAYRQYLSWIEKGSIHVREFLTCFEQMRDPFAVKERVHGTFDRFHFFKRRRTRERPFFFTEPNPINLYPERPVERVTVCALAVEQGNGQYDPTADQILADLDDKPFVRLSDLNRRDLTLLVPLGTSPMVATQTYTLLNRSEVEGKPRIPVVALIYPERNPVISNAARLLHRQFNHRGAKVEDFPIRDLRDLDSTEACNTYLSALVETIVNLRTSYPDRQVALSLSGGRKGMSALAYFAAQYTGVNRVFHTLISDANLERRIEMEMTVQALNKLPSDDARAHRLFLDEYGLSNFELFAIPVIPFDGNMA